MFPAITPGAESQSVVIHIMDSTDGSDEQAVEHNSEGISLWYWRPGSTKTAIAPAALAALDSAYSSGGIEHIDDGDYRLDLPNAAVAAGVPWVRVGGTVTGMLIVSITVPLNLASAADINTAVEGGQVGIDTAEIVIDTRVIGALGVGLTALATQASVDAIKAETALIVEDTNELQTDDYPTSIAAIKAETALILADTAVIGALGAGLTALATQASVDAIKAETALIVADTDELQTDDYPTTLAALASQASVDAVKAETALIVADTDELQTDDYPTSIAAVKAETALILADTAVIGALGAGLTALATQASVDAIKAETALIVADTDELQTDDYPASIAAVNALIVALENVSQAQVNAQVVDVLKTDTLGEPAQGAPPEAASMEAKIAWVYKFLTNLIKSSPTLIEVYNRAGAVVDHKADVGEVAGVVSRGKFESGP